VPDTWTASAAVPTDAAERYAKQLASHLGRKAEVREEAEGRRVVLGGGSCLLVAGDRALELRAEATSAESLEQVQRVVGSHLERFGQRNELVVVWA
jgi:hypothetical protein